MKTKLMVLALAVCMPLSAFAQKKYTLKSPDGKLQAEVTVGSDIRFSLNHEGTEIMAPSRIQMSLKDGLALGGDAKVRNVSTKAVSQLIPSPVYKKNEVKDVYNETVISFRGNYGLIFRLYDDGMAYRFETKMKNEIYVTGETAEYRFPQDFMTWTPLISETKKTFEEQFFNSFERPYTHKKITELDHKQLAFLPLLVDLNNGKKLCITEADLENYPGMYLNSSKDQPLFKGVFAPYPKKTVQGGHNQLQMLVTEHEDYIAKTKGTRCFPWRVFIVSGEDKELADNDMVYRLAAPTRINDVSWIKPGKVAWDWWNDWNLYGVDFEAGINNETYKYYIDFASKNGIEYVILDEGWAVNLQADLLQVIPEIDLPMLVEYGKARNVNLILWAGYWAFDRDMENVVKHYADMGIKGFKVDFMDRDDQPMVDFIYRAAETCARYQMLLDFHGMYKPTGLQRTYPHVINIEGVFGQEIVKWTVNPDQVTYDVTIPFIRMVAGPLDYTQGAMRNATKNNYRSVNSEPMSQGTRCRQLATYVIFESPLNMLCDNPSNYMREPECTEFIAKIPTVWDETIALDGSVGEYVTMARRNGNDWYIGGMTNWDVREVEVDLSFLGDGDYKLELFRDGINAHRAARDYKKETLSIPANRKVKIKMAPGGGFAMRVVK